MAWVKLDDKFPDHPKVVGLSDAAFRAYIVALSYANRYLTDGFVPVPILPKPRIVAELVGAGLWDRVEESGRFLGVSIHDYIDFQPSSSEKIAQKTAQSFAKSQAGKARAFNAERDENGAFVGTKEPDLLGSAGDSEPAESPADEPADDQQRAGASAGEAPPAAHQPRTRTRTPRTNLAPRERAALFDALAEVCQMVVADLTASGRGAMNRAVADLAEVGATPEEVKRRAARWPFQFRITPSAFAKHYAALAGPILRPVEPPPPEPPVDAVGFEELTEEQRKAWRQVRTAIAATVGDL